MIFLIIVVKYPIRICEMYLSSSLVAVVCDSQEELFTPKNLYFFNLSTEETIACMHFKEDILGIKMNKS